MTTEREPFERLADPEDQAQRAADMFLGQALAGQQLRAAKLRHGTPGVCSNCGEVCLPTAVYCDAQCREDHESRVRAEQRQRGS